MQKNLVIVESPAKAKTIEKFLGKDYKVMSSYGHIRDLKKKNFGVDLKTFHPEYEIPEDKRHVVDELRAQAATVEAVWLASDEDREGEAISWHLAEVLGLDPHQERRIVFHEITKPAILSAIEKPRAINLNLVDAQQARRVLDRLVGFKLSPVLWRKVRPSLSAGRVQSVAVRLVVEREREIAAFQSEAAYRVTAVLTTPTGGELRAEYSKRFKDKASATAFVGHCRDASFVVDAVSRRPTKRTPAPPFTTSTLQQEAARKLGYPVAMTMRLAQTLYEAGKITYMRTDSMNLSELCLNACGPVIEARMGKGYHKRRHYHTQAKGAQEAHEAIRPTDMGADTIEGTPQERRLYDLIWKRTIACQMADAQLEKTTIAINLRPGDATDGQFVATGEVVTFDGFLKVYRESRDTAETESDSEGVLLPAVASGETLTRGEVVATERFTQHPPRYNEASLVHKMEELGIGRPSTYAPTISTIQQRQYVAKGERQTSVRPYTVITLTAAGDMGEEVREEKVGAEKGRLIPTDIGLVVNDFLLQNFPEIMDYNFTANVEKDFDAIAEGHKEWTSLIRTFYDGFEPEVERTLNEKSDHKVGERELGTDPATGHVVLAKIGRYGPMIQIGRADAAEKPRFATLPTGMSLASITLEEALDLFKLPRTLGELDGEPVVVGAGRFGPYVVHKKVYASLDKGEDPMSVTLERAEELLRAKREAEAKTHIKTFEDDPDMEVRTGRYGPYISYHGVNYKIPKDKADRAATLTIIECRLIIEAEQKKPAKSPRRRTAKK